MHKNVTLYFTSVNAPLKVVEKVNTIYLVSKMRLKMPKNGYKMVNLSYILRNTPKNQKAIVN